mgnify:FL=1
MNLNNFYYRVDNLRHNSLVVKGVVKKAGSGLATPMMTAEQKEWWKKTVEKKTLENIGMSDLLTKKDAEKEYTNGGRLTVHNSRIANANKNKQERAKFIKELGMCDVLAREGFHIDMVEEIAGISSPDILINGKKADLKSTRGTGNIVKYGKKAVKEQGADIVIFEFEKFADEIYTELNKLKRLNIHGMYFVKGENSIAEF